MESTLIQAQFEIQLSKKQSTGFNKSGNGASPPRKGLAGANTLDTLHKRETAVTNAKQKILLILICNNEPVQQLNIAVVITIAIAAWHCPLYCGVCIAAVVV